MIKKLDIGNYLVKPVRKLGIALFGVYLHGKLVDFRYSEAGAITLAHQLTVKR